MSSLKRERVTDDDDEVYEVFGREISRFYRDILPAHCTFKIESFSDFLKSNTGKYESSIFKVSGYHWRVSIYPKGRNKGNEDHLSMYLEIVDTSTRIHNWEVNVNYKLFVYNYLKDKYYTIQDVVGKVRRFYSTKTEWGFDRLLSLQTLTDASKGYIRNDCCVFGAEVFVIKHLGSTIAESPSITTTPEELNPNNPYTWKVDKFSTVKHDYISKNFVVGGCTWSLHVYPNGRGEVAKNKYLSMYLKPCWVEQYPKLRLYTEFKLRIKNQFKSNDYVDKTCSKWFSASSSKSRSYPKFISLMDLRDASKGFVLNDTIILEVEIMSLSILRK